MSRGLRIHIVLCLMLGVILSCAQAFATPKVYRPTVVEGDGERAQGFFTAGLRGATIAVPGGAHLVLDPGATVRVFGGAQALRLPGGYSSNVWSVSVREGRVQAHVKHPRLSALLLTASDNFSLVIAKGHGVLASTAGGATAANLSGESHTIVRGLWQKLEQQQIRSVKNGEDRAITSETLPAPMLLPGQRIWFAGTSNVSLSGLMWEPVPGAGRYQVLLRTLGTSEVVSETSSQTNRLQSGFAAVAPGRYEVVVRAIDGHGMPGRWSAAMHAHVIGVELPSGAFVSQSGAINLSKGQEARFTHTEGLELTYSGARRFLAATSPVSLVEGRRTMVSFRLPGSLDLEIAKLEPRKIWADVEVGPKTATWPHDTVTATIRLRTEAGEPLPMQIELNPRVMIGVEPVAVTWERGATEWRATIPRSTRKGPWVIRVEVEDQYGLPLGRDFLEVIQSRKPGK